MSTPETPVRLVVNNPPQPGPIANVHRVVLPLRPLRRIPVLGRIS